MNSNTQRDAATPTKRNRQTSEPRKITDALVKNAKATGSRYEIKDGVCQGFTLRVGASGSRTFAFMGRDANSKTRTITLGKYPDISVKEAREAAYEKRRVIKDPVKLSALLAAPTSNSQITFGNLIKEAEAEFGETRKIWQQRGKRYPRSTARQVIECVFSAFLTEPAINISAEEIALRAKRYKPKSGKPSANGQVSRALAYLRPVFDWASHRTKRF